MDTPPSRTDFALANGVRLHYLDWGGPGETLLLLPGFGDSTHIFDNFAPNFTDRFRVLGLTRRGHPCSETPDSGYDANTLAEDIHQFLNELDIDRVLLVGHSMASGEMTHFAALHPGRTSGLVYLDAAYDWTEMPAILAQNPCVNVAPPESDEEIHASVDAYLAHLLRIGPSFLDVWSDLLDREFRRQIAVQADGTATDLMPPSVAAALQQGMCDYHPEYEAVVAPILAFYAIGAPSRLPDYWTEEQRTQYTAYVDNLVIPWKRRSLEQLRGAARNCRIVEMRGANHYIFLDRENVVVAEMHSFLHEIQPSPFPAA
jgi:pimeloyl-ACP methyl ester carboxylesterase